MNWIESDFPYKFEEKNTQYVIECEQRVNVSTCQLFNVLIIQEQIESLARSFRLLIVRIIQFSCSHSAIPVPTEPIDYSYSIALTVSRASIFANTRPIHKGVDIHLFAIKE